MKAFNFNNISSEELGIVVKSMPSVPSAERNIESLKVSGRNGNLHIDYGNYSSINYTIECICTDKSKLDLISNKLKGTHDLKLSINDDRYWKATIKNQITYKEYLTYLDSFPLIFELDPIAKGIVEHNEVFEYPTNFIVGGNINVNPKITIIGVGKMTLNGKTIEVLESNITIDCELMQCTNNYVSKNDKVILDEFPNLEVGENSISFESGITQVLIDYREGWI